MRWDAFQRLRRADWSGVAAWALAFGLVAYLGLNGGGYDQLVHDRVGIAVWWVVLAGVAIGALPRRRLPPLAWAALGLLAAFVAWTALSSTWTESAERTAGDLARVAGYLGVFALGLLVRGDGPRRIVAGVAAGIALVSAVALLSRLHPAWFPEANQTAILLNDPERLSYPLNYWNGVGALIAIGFPLLLAVAGGARTAAMRALACAALPALGLTIFFTLSRGGIAAAVAAVAVFLALAPDRLPRLLTAAIGVAGGAILIAAAAGRDALQEGLLGPVARQQGDEMLTLTLVVCLAAGLLQAGLGHALRGGRRPGWSFPSRRQSRAALAAAAVVALVAVVAVDVPGRAADGWDEFKTGGNPGGGAERLGSVAGQSRYALWRAAIDQSASEPLTGTGSGTFEFWWARNGTTDETVRDTHSLYLQTLGELGIVGLALLLAFLSIALAGGARNTVRAAARDRPALAAALAGCTALCLTAAIDWTWQIPVLPVSMLLLAAALLGVGATAAGARAALGPWARAALAAAALAAIAAIAIPLAGANLLRQSEAAAREGDLDTALRDARSAQNAQPGAAGPRLQQALVLEQLGNLRGAAAAARAAAEREETNWRNWLVLARVEARRGDAAAAVRAYRRARSLNPRSSLFE